MMRSSIFRCLFSGSSTWKGFCSLLQRPSSQISAAVVQQIKCISPRLILSQQRCLSTTAARLDLMEFFDDPKNWGEKEVRVGRSWKVDELRLKSNSDLHKLWYILLKERNMLLTMEYDAKSESRLFPNPERIDKVEESMENIETVVRERNRAYYLLETGTTGEQSGEEFENWLGLPEYRQYEEYPVPKEENQEWFQKMAEIPTSSRKEKALYFKLLRQKQRKDEKKNLRLMLAQIHETFRLYPDLDIDALKAKYPDVKPEMIDKISKQKKDIYWENNVEPHRQTVWGNRIWPKRRRLTWRKKYVDVPNFPQP